MRRTLFSTVALLLVAPAAPAAARALDVAAGSARVSATAGTACTEIAEEDGTPRAECSAVAYPLATRGRLLLRGRARIQLRFEGDRPSSVKWRLLQRTTAGSPTVLAGSASRSPSVSRRFAFSLPRRIPCAAVLDVFASYGSGQTKSTQDFWAAVRVKRCG